MKMVILGEHWGYVWLVGRYVWLVRKYVWLVGRYVWLVVGCAWLVRGVEIEVTILTMFVTMFVTVITGVDKDKRLNSCWRSVSKISVDSWFQ